MNSKSENNKFDIVSEAEAVLEAYAQRCRVYAKKSEKRKQKGWKIVIGILFGLCILAVLYWRICL